MPNKEVQFEQPSLILLFFNRFWVIVTAILVGVLLLGGYYLFIQPKLRNNEVLREAALKTTVDQEKSQQLLNNLEDLKNVYDNILSNRQNDLERLKEIVPDNPQVAELFVMTDRLSKQFGFSLDQIEMSEVKDGDTGVQRSVDAEGNVIPSTAPAVSVKSSVGLKAMSISFVVTPVVLAEGGSVTVESKSNYQIFKEYLDALEKNLRLVDIQSINFVGTSSNSSSASSYNFTVLTYYR